MTAFFDFMNSQEGVTFWLLCGFFLIVAVIVVPRLLGLFLALIAVPVSLLIAWFVSRDSTDSRRYYEPGGTGKEYQKASGKGYSAPVLIVVAIAFGLIGFAVGKGSVVAEEAAHVQTLNDTWK